MLSRQLDRLVSREARARSYLHVTLVEYLDRVANLYLKINGVEHRRDVEQNLP